MYNFSAPTPIATLWQNARAWFADALDVFGGPENIRRIVDRLARRTIARQLKALEALVMKLLLIEAANLAPRPAAPQRTRAASPQQGRTTSAIDPTQPETWRVCYQIQIPPEPTPRFAPRIRSLGRSRFIRATVLSAKALLATKCANTIETREHASAEKLARRFEALRRVFANPLPRARRLQRKLLALKQRAFAAAKRIALRKPPPRQLDPLFHERAQYAAEHAAPAFNTG